MTTDQRMLVLEHELAQAESGRDAWRAASPHERHLKARCLVETPV